MSSLISVKPVELECIFWRENKMGTHNLEKQESVRTVVKQRPFEIKSAELFQLLNSLCSE